MARRISQKVDDEQREARRHRENQEVFEQLEGAAPQFLELPEIEAPDTSDESPYHPTDMPAPEDFDVTGGPSPQEAALQERERQKSLGRYYQQGKEPPPYLLQPPVSGPGQDDMGIDPGVAPPGEEGGGGAEGLIAAVQAMHHDLSARLDALTELVEGITEEGGAKWQ